MAVENDVTYVVVLFGNGPFNCMVPDFTLLATGETSAGAISEAKKLVEEAIAVSKRYGAGVPVPTAQSVIMQKWNSSEYAFSSVVVRA